jgi:hypothetical protein
MSFGPFDVDSMKKILVFKEDLDEKQTGKGGTTATSDICIPKPMEDRQNPDPNNPFQTLFYNGTADLNYQDRKDFDASDPLNRRVIQTLGAGESVDTLPQNMTLCSDTFYSSDQQGCCLKDTDPAVNPSPNDKCPDGKDTNLNYEVIDENGNSKLYNVCHRDNLTEFYEKEPGLIKFLMYALFALIILVIIALVGCSYEFWLHYGASIDCLYYQSKCNNRGERGDKATLIELIFPNRLTYYPYQPCLPCSKYPGAKTRKDDLVGGGDVGNGKQNKIVSTFAVHYINNSKCISLDDEYKKCTRPFPYNIADYAENSKSEYLKALLKTICFFFIIPLLILRKTFAFILTGISKFFQKRLKNYNMARSGAFLLFSGLLSPFLRLAGINIGPINIFANPLSFLGIILTISSFLSLIGYVMTWVLVLFPRKIIGLLSDPSKSIDELINYFPKIDEKNNILHYYSLFTWKMWYSAIGKPPTEMIWNIIKNIFLVIPFFILVVLCISISFMAYSFCGLYFAITTVIQIFYYPLSNKLEFYDLIKSHGRLLTVIFCILVFVAGSQALKEETRGMMGFVLACIILFSLFKAFKN